MCKTSKSLTLRDYVRAVAVCGLKVLTQYYLLVRVQGTTDSLLIFINFFITSIFLRSVVMNWNCAEYLQLEDISWGSRLISILK